ncbi:Uu.00g046010.m01.CDS01 [Anthostomella pinea]|uniref:Uu.00g046010.m01.CDS01 n=1 Tax=Anthostomella pinea TaxID=933095 RepID=A0AAI8VBC9_9PEZI|nr:Uu.00g046010.m01.CDS01 [Anthostomella pinea]
MRSLVPNIVCLLICSHWTSALNFTTAGGQIFTPGFAVLDAPQPGTPLGGDTIEVALDVSANGKLNLPPYDADSPSLIHNITIFLYSYDTGRNFTITNGTASTNNASLGDIMASEPGSTVKHVKWTWPDCLIGVGQPTSQDSDHGEYNISIRQNFRLNNEEHYTIFDVPISVTNKVEFVGNNPSCDSVNNLLLTPEEIDAHAANSVGILFAPGDATVVQQAEASSGDGDSLGPLKPEGDAANGLGSGAGALEFSWRSAVLWISAVAAICVFSL